METSCLQMYRHDVIDKHIHKSIQSIFFIISLTVKMETFPSSSSVLDGVIDLEHSLQCLTFDKECLDQGVSVRIIQQPANKHRFRSVSLINIINYNIIYCISVFLIDCLNYCTFILCTFVLHV